MKKLTSFLREYSGYFCIGLVVLYYSLQFSIHFVSVMKMFLMFGFLFGLVFLLLNLSIKKAILTYIFLPVILILVNFDTRFVSIYLFSVIVYIDKENFLKYLKIIFFINFVNTIFILVSGYSHINGLAMQLGVDIILCIIVYENLIKKKHIVALLGFTIVVFLFTNVAQFLICMGLYLGLLLLRDNYYIIKVLESKLIAFSFVGAAVANIFFSISLHSNILGLPNFLFELVRNFSMKLDALMNYRLSLSQISLNLFGFSLFGNVLNYEDPRLQEGYFNVDSGYVQLLQTKGLFVFVVTLILFTCIIYFFQKRQMYTMIIMSITLALWGINEDIILSTKINIALLYSGFAVKNVLDLIKQRKRSMSDEIRNT